MKPKTLRMTLGALSAAAAGAFALTAWPHTKARTDASTDKIVSAANAFLATLSPEQKKRELFAFDDLTQRRRWSNFPTSFVRRAGLKMGELDDKQRAAVMTLLQAALSPRGYEKVQQIMEGDEALKGNEGGNPIFGKDLFYISILGTPSETTPWMFQFGGHHLALNITVAGAKGILTPSLTGAQPAMYTLNGKTVRPLGAESDKGYALLASLTDAQKKTAILSFQMADLVLGPGQDGKTIVPEGLKATEMTDHQRTLMLDVIQEWTGIVHENAAKARMEEVKAGLNDTYFAWSGPTSFMPGHNIRAYYRIQGPKLVIEYSPQNLGGDPALHVHTIYRDPTNDYGKAVSGQ